MLLNRHRMGFTLIELLVVISIIGVLTAILLPNFVGIRDRAADSKTKSDLGQLKKALRIYYNDYQTYPANNGNGDMMGCDAAACAEGGEFSSNGTVYMKTLPEAFEYQQLSSGEDFLLAAKVQNASDSELAPAATRCGVAYSAGDQTYYVCAD